MDENNILLNDTKERRKSKQEELDTLTKEFERQTTPLNILIHLLDKEIERLEGKTESSAAKNPMLQALNDHIRKQRSKINIDNEILQVLGKYGAEKDFNGKLRGMNPEDVWKCFEKEGIEKGSINTVRDRLKRMYDEGRIGITNENVKNKRRYILKDLIV